ncbi:MAG TPA: carbon-nitrogen hydrolase family protein [Gaiellaceae bacterium]|nr:carbon-nitrogen hydrolase family protein [Gaiellaceae bacterium]
MHERLTVACAQVEPVIFDRDATIEKLGRTAAEAAGKGARLVVFPEAVIPAYPSSIWAKALAGWAENGAKEAFALLAREAVEVPGPAERRLGELAREHEVWLVTGVTERDPAHPGTLYNALLFHGPDGELALKHRKLVPTNHERLVWGQGDGDGLEAVETPYGRLGGLVCWENYMPLARFALYESGIELYVASTADDSEAWQSTLVHLARESRCFVIAPSHFQRAASYPDDFPLARLLEGIDVIGRGGSAILAPDGSYLAGPLWDEEGVLYAELDPARLDAERQRFDPTGHYHRPDVLGLDRRA